MTRSQLITKVANDTNMTSAEVEKAEVCPACNHPQSYFEIHAENY